MAVARKSLDQSRRAKGGARAEDVVDHLNSLVAFHDGTILRRVPTPYRVVSSDGATARVVWTKRSTVDYLGWTKDGRAVLVEVKRITVPHGKTPRLPLSRIEPHQAQDLGSAHRAGALAIVLVVNAATGTVYAVPWDAFVGSGPRSVDCSPHELRVGSSYVTSVLRWEKMATTPGNEHAV